MTFQTKKQQAIFPDLPTQHKFLNEDGTVNAYWLFYFENLTAALQSNFKPEGIVIPQKTATEIADLIGTPTEGSTAASVSNANIVYDSTNNAFKGNVNGTWKTFTVS